MPPGRFTAERAPGAARVGVVGAGVVSAQYLDTLAQCADTDVRFVADADSVRAETVAARHGVAGSGTLDDLLARDDLDIVVNLTPPAAHIEVAARAIDAGLHVWIEKPLGLDRDDAAGLLEAAASAGLRVACSPDTLLAPGMQDGLRTVAAGAIGAPLSARVAFAVPGPEQVHPNPAFLFAHGSGPTLDMGPYYVTALVRSMGPIVAVSAMGSRARTEREVRTGPRAGELFPVEVPTQLDALLRFASGAQALATFSFDAHVRRVGQLEVQGTDGTVVFPDPGSFDGVTRVVVAGSVERESQFNSVARRGIGVVDLARSIATGITEQASGSLGFHVMDALLALHESADADGAWVSVSSVPEVAPPLAADWDPLAATLL